MKFDEMETQIPCKNGAYQPLNTNGVILFEILKELQKMNDTLNQWDQARRELEIWHSK